jgi:hypothetical protein
MHIFWEHVRFMDRQSPGLCIEVGAQGSTGQVFVIKCSDPTLKVN